MNTLKTSSARSGPSLSDLLRERDRLNSATQAALDVAPPKILKTATSDPPRRRSGYVYAGRGCYETANSTVIAKARRSRRMTQADCAKFCGVALRTFQRAEAGDLSCRASSRRKIERALGAVW